MRGKIEPDGAEEVFAARASSRTIAAALMCSSEESVRAGAEVHVLTRQKPKPRRRPGGVCITTRGQRDIRCSVGRA